MARKGENIFKRKDGRWEGRYIKEYRDGKAIYGFVFGKSYKEVKEKKSLAIFELSAESKPMESQNKQPFMRDIGLQWLDEIKSMRRKSTAVKYMNQLNKHIFPMFENKRIDEITNNDLLLFTKKLLSGNGNESKKLSPKSVSDILSRMKSIRKFALICGYNVKFMPDYISIPQNPKTIRVLTLTEEKILLNYLKEHPDLTSLGILICLFTGIRIGELCALMWNDISLEKQELYIHHTMQRLQNLDKNNKAKTYISIDKPKSMHSVRTIPIPNSIIEDLKSAYVEGAYLLTGKANKFIEPRTMENHFKAILKICHIEDANFHALRHSFATRCVEAGFDIKSLSEILGHASVNITLNRYVHPSLNLKRKNMEKLTKLFAVK